VSCNSIIIIRGLFKRFYSATAAAGVEKSLSEMFLNKNPREKGSQSNYIYQSTAYNTCKKYRSAHTTQKEKLSAAAESSK